ncbi:MAG: hypothetical protein U0R80_20665, partial [Nocardioidaceae bacterium]
RRAMSILMVLRHQAMAGHLAKPPHAHTGGEPGPPDFVLRANAVLLERLTFVFEQHRDELRTDPGTAALVLRSLVFGAQHPGMSGQPTLGPDEIADAVLHGVTRKDHPCS